jgi:hypothetical protein
MRAHLSSYTIADMVRLARGESPSRLASPSELDTPEHHLSNTRS